MSNTSTKIEAAISAALTSTIARPDVSADATAIAPIVQAIAPIVANASNAEPWYRSRVLVGSISASISSGLGIYGLITAGVTDGELYAPLVATLLGSGFAIYGRMIAAKPLGQ